MPKRREMAAVAAAASQNKRPTPYTHATPEQRASAVRDYVQFLVGEGPFDLPEQRLPGRYTCMSCCMGACWMDGWWGWRC